MPPDILDDFWRQDRRQDADYTSAYWLARWYSVVEEFPNRHVTLAEDRLNALAGLAAIVAFFLHPHDKYQVEDW
jgi:hypothetical protein